MYMELFLDEADFFLNYELFSNSKFISIWIHIVFLNSESITEFWEGAGQHWFLLIYLTDPELKVIVWGSMHSHFFADPAVGKFAGILDRIWK